MECPRCDRPLERYALGGREAVVCESCGYIGVPVEHGSEHREVESWDDALSRFHEVSRVDAGSVETTDDRVPPFVVEDGDGDPKPTVVRVEGSGNSDTADAERNGSAAERSDTGSAVETGDTGTEAVTCDVCGKRFDARSKLNGHMAVHSSDGE